MLGARRGSIITDFELLGHSQAEVSAAVTKIEEALQGGSLPATLCAATRAGPACKVELVHSTVVVPPRKDEARSLWEEDSDIFSQAVLICAIGIVSFLVGLVAAVALITIYRRRRQASQQKEEQPATKMDEPSELVTVVPLELGQTLVQAAFSVSCKFFVPFPSFFVQHLARSSPNARFMSRSS